MDKKDRFKELWRRSKDGDRKEQRSFARYAIVLTAVMMLFMLFLKKDNVLRWVQAGFVLRHQERQIEKYEEEIRLLDGMASVLKENRDSLEKFARQTYQFAEPGEDVYLLK